MTYREKLFVLFTLLSFASFSQIKIRGAVRAESETPLAGATIIEKGTDNATVTDSSGTFTMEVSSENAIIIISYNGFESKEVQVGNIRDFKIILNESIALSTVILVGSRTPARSNTRTPLPVDVITPKDIISTGQSNFDQVLQYKVPSFNAVNIPVSDAVSLLDPYEIRNLGPSRTLILVNGKRKNLSSLVYTYGIASRGETGADLSVIPIDAIKRVEILRDGASAHYGSDAIAGVVNVILKDDDEGYVTTRAGVTSEGDGESIGLSLHNGETFKGGKGFINYTLDVSQTDFANRPGQVNALGESIDFNADLSDVEDFLNRHPDAKNINSTPKNITVKFLLNGEYELNKNNQLYFNAAYLFKNSNSFANYRTPYWRTIEQYPYLSDFFPAPNTANNYDGYVPTFDGILKDYNATLGFYSTKNDWNYDMSITLGGNSQRYTVRNSHNGNSVLSPITWDDMNQDNIIDPGELIGGEELYRENSPINFDVGGTDFMHVVANMDISKQINDNIGIAFGTEFRSENYEIIAGELASYDGGGSDSFAGSRPEDSKNFNRYNWGGYFDLSYDIDEKLLANATVRAENYSDFGNAFVWKLSSRYILNDNYTIRGSISTGFRAPTLHQIYSQKLQYSFVAGQGIQITGLINNISPDARRLGIPQLDAERSTNLTFGLGARLSKNLNLTLDYYNIAIRDRVVLSYEVFGTDSGNTDLDVFLNERNLKAISFFINGLDTRTNGLDLVLSYKHKNLGGGDLYLNFSGNYMLENKQVGTTKNPQIIEDAGQSVVNRTQESVLFTSRPKTKWILNNRYEIKNFDIILNNTYFGKATFMQQGLDENLRTEFIPQIMTDLGFGYQLSEKIRLNFNINNLFNIRPRWKFVAENAAGESILADENLSLNQRNLITFNQRYNTTTYDGFHFSQTGTMFNAALQFKL
ncbi:TonB-dependent receptor [Winogradskyella sp.]|uniref:TonB-dependent receptor n=1 Tax=Winogradskyella sp. TaxID=1883156 RepID=UPI003BA860BF